MKERLIRGFEKYFLPRWLVLFADFIIITIIFIFVVFLRYNLATQYVPISTIALQLCAGFPFFLIGWYLFKPHHSILRRTAINDAIAVVKAHLLVSAGFLFISLVSLLNIPVLSIPWSVIFIHFFVSVFTLISIRFGIQYVYNLLMNQPHDMVNIMIFGGGELGLIAKGVIKNDNRIYYNIVGFIDDNPGLQGKLLRGVMVYSVNDAFDRIVLEKNVKEVILAIRHDKIDLERKREIADLCIEKGLKIKEIPAPSNWINGQLRNDQIRPLQIEDLLGRDPIEINNETVKKGVKSSRIMVTGAAGSIGSEIVRQLVNLRPVSIILLDQAESALYDLQFELKPYGDLFELNFVVADVTDGFRLRQVFEKYQPNIVFHASAYKHVPLMEEHPYEAIRNNLLGTKNVADLAKEFNVQKFVMVSTDKAVNPTNVMGATKRLSEVYIQALSLLNGTTTQFITTRFGNVLGSNGSVIPLFQKQISKGGPVTITHKDIVRYFMTIPEACQLVLEAAFMGKGGEIFLFDMGKPVKILEMAEKMIALSGLVPYRDIGIIETGLRPGEKLFEELLASKEDTQPTQHPKIMIGKIRPKDYDFALTKINDLIVALPNEGEFELVRRVKEILPRYVSNNSRFEKVDEELKKILHDN